MFEHSLHHKREGLLILFYRYLLSKKNEMELLKKLNHPNIVSFRSFIETETSWNFVLEYVENGSLLKMISKFGCFPEELVITYIHQTLEGLEYLHKQKVVHRDIKAGNVLITKTGQVKIADFGISVYTKDFRASVLQANNSTNFVGSPYWMAPEVIEMKEEHSASPKIDIWSLACLIIELLEGCPPYFEMDPITAMFSIVQMDKPPYPTSSTLSHDFLDCCFQKDVSKRASASELLLHRWMKLAAEDEVYSVDELSKDLEDYNRRYSQSSRGSVDSLSRAHGTMGNSFHSLANLVSGSGNDQLLEKLQQASEGQLEMQSTIYLSGGDLGRSSNQISPRQLASPPPANTDENHDTENTESNWLARSVFSKKRQSDTATITTNPMDVDNWWNGLKQGLGDHDSNVSLNVSSSHNSAAVGSVTSSSANAQESSSTIRKESFLRGESRQEDDFSMSLNLTCSEHSAIEDETLHFSSTLLQMLEPNENENQDDKTIDHSRNINNTNNNSRNINNTNNNSRNINNTNTNSQNINNNNNFNLAEGEGSQIIFLKPVPKSINALLNTPVRISSSGPDPIDPLKGQEEGEEEAEGGERASRAILWQTGESRLLSKSQQQNQNKNTPPLQESPRNLERTSSQLGQVEDQVFRRLHKEKMASVCSLFRTNFKSDSRLFIRQGTFLKKCRKTNKKRDVFLFSDILVYAPTPSGRASISFFGPRYSGEKKIDLIDCDVTAKDTTGICIQSVGKSFILTAENQNERDEWIRDINACLDNLQIIRVENDHFSLAPVWEQDDTQRCCTYCRRNFTLINRRHHCRNCGKLVCNTCSKNRVYLPNISLAEKVRCCNSCTTRISVRRNASLESVQKE